MPGRIAMGATTWWEPVLAAALTLATIIGLVLLAGRIYTNAILHSGPRLSLQAARRSTTTSAPRATTLAPRATNAGTRITAALWHRAGAITGGRTMRTRTDLSRHRLLMTVLTGIAVALGAGVAVLTSDVIIGAIVGAGFSAITVQMVKLWTGHSGPPVAHH